MVRHLSFGPPRQQCSFVRSESLSQRAFGLWLLCSSVSRASASELLPHMEAGLPPGEGEEQASRVLLGGLREGLPAAHTVGGRRLCLVAGRKRVIFLDNLVSLISSHCFLMIGLQVS